MGQGTGNTVSYHAMVHEGEPVMNIKQLYYWVQMKLAIRACMWNGNNGQQVLTENKKQKELRCNQAVVDWRYYWGKLRGEAVTKRDIAKQVQGFKKKEWDGWGWRDR